MRNQNFYDWKWRKGIFIRIPQIVFEKKKNYSSSPVAWSSAPIATLVAKSRFSSFFNRSRINSAIALCVRLSRRSSFLAASRFKSQSGFLGARFETSFWESGFRIILFHYFNSRRFIDSSLTKTSITERSLAASIWDWTSFSIFAGCASFNDSFFKASSDGL